MSERVPGVIEYLAGSDRLPIVRETMIPQSGLFRNQTYFLISQIQAELNQRIELLIKVKALALSLRMRPELHCFPSSTGLFAFPDPVSVTN